MQDRQVKNNLNKDHIECRREVSTKKKWHKPKLEDVSGKVMAQPYIRFT